MTSTKVLSEQGRLAHALFDRLVSVYPENEAYHTLSQVSLALYGGSIICALLLWGLGLWWLFLAIMSVKSISVTSLNAFNVSWKSPVATSALALTENARWGSGPLSSHSVRSQC